MALLTFALSSLCWCSLCWFGRRYRSLSGRLVMMSPVHMHHRRSAIGDLAFGSTLEHELRDMHVLIGSDHDGEMVALLDVVQVRSLLIEDIERDIDCRGGDKRRHAIGDQAVLDRTQDVERDRLDRAHHAGALAHGAWLGRAF